MRCVSTLIALVLLAAGTGCSADQRFEFTGNVGNSAGGKPALLMEMEKVPMTEVFHGRVWGTRPVPWIAARLGPDRRSAAILFLAGEEKCSVLVAARARYQGDTAVVTLLAGNTNEPETICRGVGHLAKTSIVFDRRVRAIADGSPA